MESKDPLAQLPASKSSIKDVLKTYQIILKTLKIKSSKSFAKQAHRK